MICTFLDCKDEACCHVTYNFEAHDQQGEQDSLHQVMGPFCLLHATVLLSSDEGTLPSMIVSNAVRVARTKYLELSGRVVWAITGKETANLENVVCDAPDCIDKATAMLVLAVEVIGGRIKGKRIYLSGPNMCEKHCKERAKIEEFDAEQMEQAFNSAEAAGFEIDKSTAKVEIKPLTWRPNDNAMVTPDVKAEVDKIRRNMANARNN